MCFISFYSQHYYILDIFHDFQEKIAMKLNTFRYQRNHNINYKKKFYKTNKGASFLQGFLYIGIVALLISILLKKFLSV